MEMHTAEDCDISLRSKYMTGDVSWLISDTDSHSVVLELFSLKQIFIWLRPIAWQKWLLCPGNAK